MVMKNNKRISSLNVFLKKNLDFTGFEREENLAAIYDRKNNSFDLMRFIFASLVIYSHAYPLLFGASGSRGDILMRFSNNQTYFGAFSVNCFFIISGFLVLQSLLQSRSILNYLVKRMLRLLPALLICLLLSALVLGPFISNLSPQEYFFGRIGVSPFKYIFDNVTFFAFAPTFAIRDLFSQNPYPNAVNGSLWTLEFEFGFYLLLIILSFFGFFKHKKLTVCLTLFLGLLNVLLNNLGFKLFSLPINWWIFGGGVYASCLELSFYFLAGSTIYLFQDRIKFSYRNILLAFCVVLVSLKFGHFNDFALIFLPYIVIALSIKSHIKLFTKFGDFSYGIYIYAFPIEQSLVKFFRSSLNAKTLTLYTFLITLFISVLSWKFIEKPALDLKKKIPF